MTIPAVQNGQNDGRGGTMRIIGISGLCSWNNLIWRNFRFAFSEHFPGSEFHEEELVWCEWWHYLRLKWFIDHLSEKYDDGRETLFVGHSIGGVIACAVASRLEHTRTRGIVTLFSPHTYYHGVVPWMLGVPNDPGIPIVSFEASSDEIIQEGTRHPRAVYHQVIPCDHSAMLVSDKRFARDIVGIAKEKLFSSA